MSFTEILDASGAARGAIYHHFPGGKTQLVAEAAAASDELRQVADAALASWTDQLTERLTAAGSAPTRPATSPSRSPCSKAPTSCTAPPEPSNPSTRRPAPRPSSLNNFRNGAR